MTRTTCFILGAFVAVSLSIPAAAQNYRFSDGYIFDQPYVKRVSEDRADQLLGQSKALEPFRTGDWSREQFDKQAVARNGKSLTIKFSGRPPLILTDYVYTGNGDGDSQRFTYMRSVGRYHVIEVSFGHDSPGFLLVERASAQIFFAHPD